MHTNPSISLQVTVDIPYASPPQGMKYFTVIGPHIDCMDEQYLVSYTYLRLFCCLKYYLSAGYKIRRQTDSFLYPD